MFLVKYFICISKEIKFTVFLIIVDTAFEEFDENYYFHYLSGVDEGFSLDVEPNRKWTMFLLRGSSLGAHESIIFQPWTLDGNDGKSSHPLHFFTTVEMRFNEQNKPYMFVSRLDINYYLQLQQIAEIAVSIQILYDYLTEIFLSLQTTGLAGNCVEFVIRVANILPFHRRCDVWRYPEDTYCLRLRKRYKPLFREKIDKAIQNMHVEDIHSTVGGPIFKLRDRIAHVFTDIQGKYNAMTPIHTMFIMVMFYFDTIGEIIFPIITFFSVFHLYYAVMSYYWKREVESSRATFCTKWNFTPKIRLLLFVIHALSILHTLYEVFNSIHCLQPMLLTQLMWLNFLFIDRELEMKITGSTVRFGTMKRLKTLKTYLFRDNIQQNLTRIAIFSTFLFPNQIVLPVLIFFQVIVMVMSSRSGKISNFNWLRVQHFTGNESPLFNLCYITFIAVIAACILCSKRIITVQCLTSKYHAFYLLILFSLSMIMHYKILQQKADYASANDGCLDGNTYEVQRVPVWYSRLSILSHFDKKLLVIFIVILTVFILTFDYMSSLFLLNVTLFIGYFITGLTCNVKFLWDSKI